MSFIKKYFIYLIIFVLLVAAIILTVINKNKSKLPQPLEITTNPSGAQIYINNQRYDDSPVTTDLKPGNYTIYFTKEGYLPLSKDIKVKAGKSNKLNVDLPIDTEPQPTEGAPIN